MPSLSITEFKFNALNEASGISPIALMPNVTEQSIAIGTTSGQSSAFNVSTRVVRLAADTACRIKFGTSPVALNNSMLMPAGGVEYFGVPQDGSFKLAVIASA